MLTTIEQTLNRQQHTLLRIVQVGVALLLLTPLVVTKTTVFPFVVGKALYWRSIVEIVFALWVLLALSTPAYRPPRSWLLILLGAILACSMLAAWFGISFQRSFWSTYERMDGVIDVAHQFAFALVVVSVFRDGQSWRVLFTMNLVASIAVALLAIANYLELPTPFYGSIGERDRPRIGSVLGNATYLGAYSAMNSILAVGFLAKSLFAMTSRAARGALSSGALSNWVPTLFWLVVAALNLCSLSLSGSFGALAGLLGGCVVLVVGGIVMARVRLRRAALALVVVLVGCLAAVVVISAISPAKSDESSEQLADNPLLNRVLNASLDDASSRSRLLAWQAGVEGFAARPWLGWGPENFLAVFGRYVTDGFARLEIHDRAHGKFIEEAVTKGLLGAASYLAFWAFVFHVLLRAVRKAGGSALAREDRILALFAGAALASYFLQSQTLFDTTVINLQYLLLVCYVAYVDTEMRRDTVPQRAGISAWLGRVSWPDSTLLRRTGAAVVACAALAVAASGLVASTTIWPSAQAMSAAIRSPQPYPYIERSTAFRPLANESRQVLFGTLANHWRMLRMRQSAKAKQLLALADAEAATAVAAEPQNWLLHHYLARLYRQVASTEPRYRARAEYHWERTYELAPHQHTFTAKIGRPLPSPNRP